MKQVYLTLVTLIVSGHCFVTGNAELNFPLFSDDANLEILLGQTAGGILRSIYESGAITMGKSDAERKDSMDLLTDIPIVLPDRFVIGNLSTGNFSLGNAALFGLSTVQIGLKINSAERMMNILVEAPKISSNGSYNVNLAIDSFGQEFNLTGAGAYDITFHNFSIALDMKVNIDSVTGNLVNISETSVTIGYHAMDTFLENFAMNGVVQDWENPDTIALFPQIVMVMLSGAKASIDQMVQGLFNIVLQACSLTEIIGGDLSCLTEPADPTSTTPTSGVTGSNVLSLLTVLFVGFLAMYSH